MQLPLSSSSSTGVGSSCLDVNTNWALDVAGATATDDDDDGDDDGARTTGAGTEEAGAATATTAWGRPKPKKWSMRRVIEMPRQSGCVCARSLARGSAGSKSDLHLCVYRASDSQSTAAERLCPLKAARSPSARCLPVVLLVPARLQMAHSIFFAPWKPRTALRRFLGTAVKVSHESEGALLQLEVHIGPCPYTQVRVVQTTASSA